MEIVLMLVAVILIGAFSDSSARRPSKGSYIAPYDGPKPDEAPNITAPSAGIFDAEPDEDLPSMRT